MFEGGNLEDAEGAVATNLAGGRRLEEASLVLAAGSDDKLASSMKRIGNTVRGLWSEALIVVIVAIENNVRAGRVQVFPEILHFRIVAVLVAGAEQRNMPKRQGALGMAFLEIFGEPLFLGRTLLATIDFSTLAVQGDDMP